MAGETIKTEAICLDIRPWSQTSHIVTWLTPNGKLSTVVKGAVRAKSAFLGQYDLNYTCEILYYARAKGELHALRDCVPLELREALRGDYRRLALAGYFRSLVAELTPVGPECRSWYGFLSSALSSLVTADTEVGPPSSLLDHLNRFDLKVLELAGLAPDFSGYDREADWSAFSIESGSFGRSDGRCVRVSRQVAEYLSRVETSGASLWSENPQIPLDAARVIGVFYQFHLDTATEVRRSVVGMISKN